MPAAISRDRGSEVIIEIVRIGSPRNVRVQVGVIARLRLHEIEAAVDNRRSAFLGRQVKLGGNQQCMTFHFRQRLFMRGVSCLVHVGALVDNSRPPRHRYAAGFSARSLQVDKILVGLKRVVDYNVRVRVRNDGSGVDIDGVKMSINPFDEIALEEALRDQGTGEMRDEVIVVSIGPGEAQQQLRTGLAMGADRAILVESDEAPDPLTCARSTARADQPRRPGSGTVRQAGDR